MLPAVPTHSSFWLPLAALFLSAIASSAVVAQSCKAPETAPGWREPGAADRALTDRDWSPFPRSGDLIGNRPSGLDDWINFTKPRNYSESGYQYDRDGSGGSSRAGRGSKNDLGPKARNGAIANSDPDSRHSNPSTCTGVIVATGEKLLDQTDSASDGLYGMTLERRYRSVGASGKYFGPNWTSNLDPYRVTKSTFPCVNTDIGCIPRDATVTFPGGAQYKYTIVSVDPGAYQANGSDALGTLQYDIGSATWLLEIDKKTYFFNAGGTLTQVLDAGGRVLLTYTGLRRSPTTSASRSRSPGVALRPA